jgi:hypothetical protein
MPARSGRTRPTADSIVEGVQLINAWKGGRLLSKEMRFCSERQVVDVNFVCRPRIYGGYYIYLGGQYKIMLNDRSILVFEKASLRASKTGRRRSR